MIRETVASNCSRLMLDSKVTSVGCVETSAGRHRLAEPFAHLTDRLDGARVGLLDPAVLDEGVGDQGDLVALVVEGDEQVGDHQRHVGQADRIGIRLGERLDRADQVVAEEADGPAGERRQLVRLGDLEAAEVVRRPPRTGPAHRSLGRARLRSPTPPPTRCPTRRASRRSSAGSTAAGSPGRTSGRADPAPPTRAGRRGRRRAA